MSTTEGTSAIWLLFLISVLMEKIITPANQLELELANGGSFRHQEISVVVSQPS